MKIEAPEDLTTCSLQELRSMADMADHLRVNALIEIKLRVREPVPTNRPRWAQGIGWWLDRRGKRGIDRLSLVIAVLVVGLITLPTLLQSCGQVIDRVEAVKRTRIGNSLESPP